MALCITVGMYLHPGESTAFRFMYKRWIFTPKMEVEVSSRMLAPFYETTLHNNAEDAYLCSVIRLQHPTPN